MERFIKWTLVIVVAVVLAFLVILPALALVKLASQLVMIALPLFVVGVLVWFTLRMCLVPRFRLRRLYRIRVRQGRRHPLA